MSIVKEELENRSNVIRRKGGELEEEWRRSGGVRRRSGGVRRRSGGGRRRSGGVRRRSGGVRRRSGGVGVEE
ncbi:MAG: hypothetical protein GY820_00415 [Gammaproteobacteria bacterium]|nr:hypothetical protein [Gammaproteobacteria bacterium]